MKRNLLWATAVPVAAYFALLAAMYAGQRHLLYTTSDGGGLAAANWVAIKGATRFSLPTPDGETLAAWYIAPKPNQPVFLFLHGKGGKLHVKKWRWKRILKRGMGILAISYRGYPGSTGTPSETGLNIDALTAYRWLTKYHPAQDVVIHGLSLGSGVAVTLATQVEARALVLEAPFTATVDVAAERYPYVPVRWLMDDRFLSRERIAQVAMPILIAHGTRDTVIPFTQAKRLFARAKQPKTFIAMQGSDHSTLVRDGLYKHIWKFLAAHP